MKDEKALAAARSMAETLSAMFPDSINMRWKNRLIPLRAETRLTLRVVGAALGISLSHYSCLERGICLPSLPVALRIARFFDKTIEEIWPSQDGEPCSSEPSSTSPSESSSPTPASSG